MAARVANSRPIRSAVGAGVVLAAHIHRVGSVPHGATDRHLVRRILLEASLERQPTRLGEMRVRSSRSNSLAITLHTDLKRLHDLLAFEVRQALRLQQTIQTMHHTRND